MASIFDLLCSQTVAAYWAENLLNEAPHIGEELFPANKQMGLNLQWIKGAKGVPVALKPSAFDAQAVPRPRIGADILKTQMPYFKESYYIDEELRQKLLIVQQNDAYASMILMNIMDDATRLLRGASAAREAMRMMALTTGVVSIFGNGQNYSFDYGVTHKSSVPITWDNHATADPIEDILQAKDAITMVTGTAPARAITDGKTWGHLRRSQKIRATLLVSTAGIGNVSDTMLKSFFLDEVGLMIEVNDKRYKSFDGVDTRYVAEGTFVMFPDGALGSTWFGTTPAEADLMGAMGSNVTISDLGVAITTTTKADPVTVETIVSQICLPSFEQADNVYILGTL
jgi:hypothetical protein